MYKSFAVLAAILALGGCGGNAQDAPLPRLATLAAVHHAQASASAYLPLVQQLYVAFFGRPADPAGLAWHADVLLRLHAPADLRGLAAAYDSDARIRSLVDGLSDSAEAQSLYGDSPALLIEALYRQGFNRDAEPAGLDYWTGIIRQHGLNRAAALMRILAGAQGSDLATFQRKTDAAAVFTGAVDSPTTRALYSGAGSNALVRDMLGVVHSDSSAAAIAARVDAGIAALSAQRAYIVQDGYAEVPAVPHTVALLVAPAQAIALRSLLDTLATVLAADLNGRSGRHGPHWSVVVREAARSAAAVREQLRAMDGAILVGDVAVPTDIDLSNGDTVPNLDPFRVPACTRYSFTPGTDRVSEIPGGTDHLWMTSEDRACRNGMTVSILRGTDSARQDAQLRAKLEQMIAYHRAADAANARWKPAYSHVEALWLRIDFERPDPLSWWTDVPLYGAGQVSYLNSGTGAQRLGSFRACLESNAEMCSFNGHGNRGLVVAEGPDPTREFYSSDSVPFPASELGASTIRAKFVNLQSCSTQNFLQPGSFGTTMLATGDALLVMGATAVVFSSTDADKGYVESMYQSLSYGATFAEALTGKMNGPALSLQGDPFITHRAKPGGAQPKLVIDGKHFNAHPTIMELAFGDSIASAKTSRTIVVTNPGTADLRLRLSIMPENVTSTNKPVSAEGDSWGGLGFTMDAPAPNDTSGFGNVGNIVHVVPPGGTLKLQMGFKPLSHWETKTLVTGTYTGTYELYSNDPQSPRVVFEMIGIAR
ncbi:hypothetical protein IM543_19690 [Massilia sp. UMI-21]|nr:hypothetical protein IM543_19690 [Massilia sp. UMI-21]